MLDMGIVGWIVVGLIAGAASGALLGGKTARGCLPNVIVGVIGGVLGGWLVTQMGMGQTSGFIGAVVVALMGALGIRLVLNALEKTWARTRLDERPYSPGLQGVVAGETTFALVDGEAGRLLYRGYPIGELVREGTYAQVAELLWTGTGPGERSALRARPSRTACSRPCERSRPTTHPMDALRTAVSAWGAAGPAGLAVDRGPGSRAHRVLAVAPSPRSPGFAQGDDPVDPDPSARARRRLPLPAHRRATVGRSGAVPSTRTSSSGRSTASTPPRSRRASSARPARTSRARSAARSAR